MQIEHFVAGEMVVGLRRWAAVEMARTMVTQHCVGVLVQAAEVAAWGATSAGEPP